MIADGHRQIEIRTPNADVWLEVCGGDRVMQWRIEGGEWSTSDLDEAQRYFDAALQAKVDELVAEVGL